MAGMKVVVVACDNNGNIDISDLKAKAEEHAKDLANRALRDVPRVRALWNLVVERIGER